MSPFDWRGPAATLIESQKRGRPRIYDDEERKQRHREAALMWYHKQRSKHMQIELIERPRARRTDPHTSHAAADRAARFASTQAGRILAVFQATPDYNYTAREIAHATGLTVVQVCRRLPEIQEIERTGEEIEGFGFWRLTGGL